MGWYYIILMEYCGIVMVVQFLRKNYIYNSSYYVMDVIYETEQLTLSKDLQVLFVILLIFILLFADFFLSIQIIFISIVPTFKLSFNDISISVLLNSTNLSQSQLTI